MTAMTQPAKAQEPSMEEILASIRRIIADDDAAKPPSTAFDATGALPLRPVAAPPASRPAPLPPPVVGLPEPLLKQDKIEAIIGDREQPRSSVVVVEKPGLLDLTDPVATSGMQGEGVHEIDASDVALAQAPDDRPQPRSLRQEPQRTLLSSATTAAVNSAFNSLAQTVLVQNARTLEDLVKEMLRPLLQTWLDDNLPVLVERLVRAEIERVSRGRA